jgi:hypothetical protein
MLCIVMYQLSETKKGLPGQMPGNPNHHESVTPTVSHYRPKPLRFGFDFSLFPLSGSGQPLAERFRIPILPASHRERRRKIAPRNHALDGSPRTLEQAA